MPLGSTNEGSGEKCGLCTLVGGDLALGGEDNIELRSYRESVSPREREKRRAQGGTSRGDQHFGDRQKKMLQRRQKWKRGGSGRK